MKNTKAVTTTGVQKVNRSSKFIHDAQTSSTWESCAALVVNEKPTQRSALKVLVNQKLILLVHADIIAVQADNVGVTKSLEGLVERGAQNMQVMKNL
jgi:hypothetical protein